MRAALKEKVMSTDICIVNKQVSMEELFDGRLESYGVFEKQCEDSNANWRVLTDGRNWLVVRGSDDVEFTTRGSNDPWGILDAIGRVFDAQIFTEYEPQFWGFDTQNEWDAAMDPISTGRAHEFDDKFYVPVIKHVNGQQSGIAAGSIGAIKALIAKALVLERPELRLPAAKEELMVAINTIYNRDHDEFPSRDAIKAMIAKTLVLERPELALPAAKEILMTAANAVYARNHVAQVSVNDSTVTLAEIAFTNDEPTSQF